MEAGAGTFIRGPRLGPIPMSEDAAPAPRALPKIGNVLRNSPRGIAAIALLALSLIGAFLSPLIGFVNLVRGGGSGEPIELDRRILAINFALNAIALLVLPVLFLSITRPGERGAVTRRLGLAFDTRTPRHILVGASFTIATMLLLGAFLYLLDRYGVYTAQESALVPQIQALLTWPLVFAISLIASITEEVFFRGFLQPRVGLWIASLLFGFVHIGYGTLLQFVAPIVLGLLFGFLYLRTGSLWAPIAAHFTFDFVELSLLQLDL